MADTIITTDGSQVEIPESSGDNQNGDTLFNLATDEGDGSSIFGADETEEKPEVEEEYSSDPVVEDGENNGIDNPEEARREEQSFKDRWYQKLQQEEDARNSMASRQETNNDPIVVELQPYISELQSLVDNGDITMADAQNRFATEYRAVQRHKQILGQTYEHQNVVQNIKGNEIFQAIRKELSKDGITADSQEEKEAFALLKVDWQLDVNSPQSFATLADVEKAKRLSHYVSAMAKQNARNRNGGAGKNHPKGVGGATKPVTPIAGENAPQYKSLRDISEAARKGKLR